MLQLLLLPLVFGITNGNCAIQDCLNYNAGCYKCVCDIENGIEGCTTTSCETPTSSFCTNCDKDRVWLVDSDKTSACSCPKGEQVTNDGCAITDECPDPSEKLLRCNYPTDDTKCTYDGLSFRYQICQDDNACEDGFYCKKVDQDIFYDTCTPIMCKLDVHCNPYDCVNDCVGIGWGTCVPDDHRFRLCDKLPHCISYNNGCDPHNALQECTMNICSNAIKSDLCVSDSDCNDGYECQQIYDMDFIEPDRCVSLDCDTQSDTCHRYSCLNPCIDSNSDNVGRCVVVDDYSANFARAMNCTCAENLLDSYCCWGKTYTNPCLAECDGIINAERKCDKGACTMDVESAHMVGVFDLTNNSRLYNDLQYNFLIVAVEFVALILFCFFIGISISYCGVNFKNVSMLIITIGGLFSIFVMIIGIKGKNGELYWNYQYNFIFVVLQVIIVALCCLFMTMAIFLKCLNYNKSLEIKATKKLLEDL